MAQESNMAYGAVKRREFVIVACDCLRVVEVLGRVAKTVYSLIKQRNYCDESYE